MCSLFILVPNAYWCLLYDRWAVGERIQKQIWYKNWSVISKNVFPLLWPAITSAKYVTRFCENRSLFHLKITSSFILLWWYPPLCININKSLHTLSHQEHIMLLLWKTDLTLRVELWLMLELGVAFFPYLLLRYATNFHGLCYFCLK